MGDFNSKVTGVVMESFCHFSKLRGLVGNPTCSKVS